MCQQRWKVGKTAGYMFYQTSDGFHFKSIDGLFAQDHNEIYMFLLIQADVLKRLINMMVK